jgi:hypothetical protein
VPQPFKSVLTSEQLTDAIAATPLVAIIAANLGWKKWRNRRRHVQGKVTPGMVAIYVAELEGDDKRGTHRTNIVQTLKLELGAAVQILRAGIEVRAEEAGDVAEEAVAGNRRAQAFLKTRHGDLLIWGRPLASLVLAFCFSQGDSFPSFAVLFLPDT